jgi:hypothetical protein
MPAAAAAAAGIASVFAPVWLLLYASCWYGHNELVDVKVLQNSHYLHLV